jgi:hypothetical protein
MTRPSRYVMSGLQALLSGAAVRPPGRSRRIGGLVARDRFRVGGGTRECHPGARMLSMNPATSSISRLSSSSASSAATSAARAARLRRRPALSRIARRIASDLLMPVASSCASACRASESRRTLMADDMPRVYHDPSYGTARRSAQLRTPLPVLDWAPVSNGTCMARPHRQRGRTASSYCGGGRTGQEILGWSGRRESDPRDQLIRK